MTQTIPDGRRRFHKSRLASVGLARESTKPFPNRRLANFTVFMQDNLEAESIVKFIETSFEEFLEHNGSRYAECQKFPIHVTGSIAFHFKKQWETVLRRHHVQIGRIIQALADDPAGFHKTMK